MEIYKLLFCVVVGLLVSLVVGPIVIKISQKFKLKQTILHYVEFHQGKQGTPTMGGFIFLVGMLIAAICFVGMSALSWVLIAVTFSFALLGFLDDFIKIKYHQNEGLKPYQKIIGQVGISLIVALYVYFGQEVGTSIIIPFSSISVDLKWGIIPFVIFILLATTNSVNLTDGLDGLAGGVSFVYLIGFSFISAIVLGKLGTISQEQFGLTACMCAMIGGLLGFLCFNCNKAKIFMGDTGSLALGGFIGAVSIFLKLELFIPILGIMFVLSALSDIIQVLHYKRTKKRVFLMAPLHHHFEKKGVNENRIVVIYIVITAVVSLISVAVTMMI